MAKTAVMIQEAKTGSGCCDHSLISDSDRGSESDCDSERESDCGDLGEENIWAIELDTGRIS